MIIRDEAEMVEYGRQLAHKLRPPLVIELLGDVGTGKTTLVRGIASGLGITETVTSPSFVINKKYHTPHNSTLSHYDFYRLEDPGIMSAELEESINDPQTISIIEWAESVADVLPKHATITIKYLEDGTRELESTL